MKIKYDKSKEFDEFLSVIDEDDNEFQRIMEEPNGLLWDGFLVVVGLLIIWWLI